MGCSNSHDGIATDEQPVALQHDEYRRGDRVLIPSRVPSNWQPSLSRSNASGSGDVSNPLEGSQSLNSPGSEKSCSIDPLNTSIYPHEAYGWIVLAVNYEKGLYAVQLANGEYERSIAASDLRLLKQRDWYSKSRRSSSDVLTPTRQRIRKTLPNGRESGSSSVSPSARDGSASNTVQSSSSGSTFFNSDIPMGTAVLASTPYGRYSGVVCLVHSDKTYSVQTDFGDYFQSMPKEALEPFE